MVRHVSLWQTMLNQPIISGAELHLWRFPLSVSTGRRIRLESYLSYDERERQHRFFDSAKAGDFAASRGCLREILGRYLALPPGKVEFDYNAAGKPALTNEHAELHFSLAHSDRLALLALVNNSAVGVDLEKIDPVIDYSAIASHYFTPQENLALQQLPTARKLRYFYRLWVGKEASLKKSGTGFTHDASADISPAGQGLLFPVARNYLGAASFSLEITSIKRYQYPVI